jgi:outer membrane receptor for ferric coprogen and ferric-rhodotorulic acid
MSESSSQRSKSNLAMLLGSWDWNITPRSTLSVGGRLQRQTGSGTAVEFDEVAAFVSADHRFD